MTDALDVQPSANSQEWDGYVAAHGLATSDHLWGWRHIFEDVFGQRTEYLIARRGGQVAGVLPLVLFQSRLFGRSVVSLPVLNYGGLLASDSSAADALIARAIETAHTFRAKHIELRHRGRQRPELPVRQHKLMFTRALPASVEALWTDTDRKVRNQVRKAEKEGLVAVEGGAELLEGFYSVFAENMRDLGTPVYSRRLFERTLAEFPDAARVFVVRAGQKTVAGAVTIRFRDTVIVPWASSLREFRPKCPNMLLYWTMLKSATEAGVAHFDFGRSSPGAGTHAFKVQWGAQEAPLNWEYCLLTRVDLPDHGPDANFSLAVKVWTKLPLWFASRLGPMIVANIP